MSKRLEMVKTIYGDKYGWYGYIKGIPHVCMSNSKPKGDKYGPYNIVDAWRPTMDALQWKALIEFIAGIGVRKWPDGEYSYQLEWFCISIAAGNTQALEELATELLEQKE